jgi:hypothetical protein
MPFTLTHPMVDDNGDHISTYARVGDKLHSTIEVWTECMYMRHFFSCQPFPNRLPHESDRGGILFDARKRDTIIWCVLLWHPIQRIILLYAHTYLQHCPFKECSYYNIDVWRTTMYLPWHRTASVSFGEINFECTIKLKNPENSFLIGSERL